MFNLSKTKPVILPFKPSMSPQLRGPAVTLSLISETLALFLNLHFFHLNYNWSPNHINSTNVIPCSLSSRSGIAIATNHICDTTLKILRGSRALIRSSTVLCHWPQALFKPSLTSLISYPATLLCSTLYFCQNKCLWSPKCVMLTLFQGLVLLLQCSHYFSASRVKWLISTHASWLSSGVLFTKSLSWCPSLGCSSRVFEI